MNKFMNVREQLKTNANKLKKKSRFKQSIK